MRHSDISDLHFDIFDQIVYKNEQNFITVLGTYNKTFRIDSIYYSTDMHGFAIIDYSDICKTYDSGEFSIIVDDEIRNFLWQSKAGIKPVEPVLPPRILKICDFSDFFIFVHLLQSGLVYQVFYDGEWHGIEALSEEILILQNWQRFRIISEDELPDKAYSEIYTLPYTGELSRKTYFYCEFQRYSCNCSDMKQLSWYGENGKRKSYTFLIAEEKRNVDTAIEVEALNNNGFDIRKNFNLSFKLQTEKLNASERAYISDLISSSEVYLSDSFRQDEPVTIAATSFVNAKNDEFEELNLDIKFKQYDTI